MQGVHWAENYFLLVTVESDFYRLLAVAQSFVLEESMNNWFIVFMLLVIFFFAR